MTIRHLLSLSRRSATRSLQSLSTASAVATAIGFKPLPSPPPPDTMTYDRLALSVNQKLKLFDNPDPRFLTHNSPFATLADHTPILSSPLTRISILPSGLRIATESDLAFKTAIVGVWIDAGSHFETDQTNGTAHFLEHMIFKGTERRSTRELEEEVENMGATSTLTRRGSRPCSTPRFDDNRINWERDMFLKEMEEVEGQTEEVIFDHLHATAFQYTPLARTILGPAQNIKTITKEDLKNYISTHYTASRMVIAASGAVKHEDIVEQVKKLFTKLSTDPTIASELVAKEPAIFTGHNLENMCWLLLLSVNNSELAQRVGINEIAESMMAFNTNYKDTGLFGVYAIAKPDCLDDLAYAITYEISKLSNT
ncbi:hypothetical protein RHMOL_Rhmol07G0273800 [Rhododendron molle]|uniref:Uncharacterized protein n=1 Tax=Rhododendron molle TaxID=49168 RepID=A0ACC0N7C8_RHOML|nr:hypothetical protein RHMOL_Rhmol07G0273800 [Rhododendron molle]